MSDSTKILVYGYGNPGRQDDALGVKLAEMIEEWVNSNGLSNIATDSNYQLNIEDSAAMKGKDLIIFTDASKDDITDFKLERLEPQNKVDFTMHHISPAFLLYLAGELHGVVPETYVMHIKGYEWEFMAEPTHQALSNLNKAFDFLKGFLSRYIPEHNY